MSNAGEPAQTAAASAAVADSASAATPASATTAATAAAGDEICRDAHMKYIYKTGTKQEDSFEYWVTQHLRVSGVYWGVAALMVLSGENTLPASMHTDGAPSLLYNADAVVDFVKTCAHGESGGYGGSKGHDAHMLYTLSAVQVLAIFDSVTENGIDCDAVRRFVLSMYREDAATGLGWFVGDEWGEVDNRFIYCACGTLSLLGCLEVLLEKHTDGSRYTRREALLRYLDACRSPIDGAYGSLPGMEGHAGNTFCCIGARNMLGDIVTPVTSVNADGGGGGGGGGDGGGGAEDATVTRRRQLDLRLAHWLCERQIFGGISDGGLNGRPEKKADVCYSWWVLASMSILKPSLEWIAHAPLVKFITACQDTEDGGIADKPGNMADIYHTFFGLAGLALLGDKSLWQIDPTYALDVRVVKRAVKTYSLA